MKKNYSFPLYITLQGELIIIRNYMELLAFFTARNPEMTAEYGQGIETRINQAIISFTTDKRLEQKAATRDIKAIVADGKIKLSDLFTDISVAYRNDKPRVAILKNELGYTNLTKKPASMYRKPSSSIYSPLPTTCRLSAPNLKERRSLLPASMRLRSWPKNVKMPTLPRN